MPVKVRCRSCQKVINAPDRARGKAIKCPNCEELVRVPSGNGKQTRRRKAPAKPRKSSAPDGEHGIAGVDLRHAEDRRVQVCPKCGAEVTEEDIDCPACGIDLATGEVSIRTLREKGLAAADPKDFYREAWSDSARFVLDNKNLVFRTGIYWSLLMLLFGGCLTLLAIFVVNFPIPKDPSKFEKLFGAKWPLNIFFGVLSFLFLAGALGWYWRLSIEVIRITMAKKKKKITKVNFDLFEAIAFGCKVFFWSYVFMIPIFFVVSLVLVPMNIADPSSIPELSKLSPLAIGLIISGVYAIPLLVFPVSMVHMSMPYTYKAWLPTEMIKIWAKNIGPALYWLMLFVVVNLLLIGILVGIGLLKEHLSGFFQGTLENWSSVILAQVGESGVKSGFFFRSIQAILAIVFAILLVTPICLLAAVPAVFTMRANGLLAFYRKDRLELIREKGQHEKAGFWVRYLAFMVDILLFPLTFVLVYKNRGAMLLNWAHKASIGIFYFSFSKSLGMPVFYAYAFISLYLVDGWMYFALNEGSPERGTIGKHAFGMVVLSEKRMKQLTMKQASLRFFAKSFLMLPLGIGFVFAALTPKKQALHDIIAKTVVVFRGDDDATTS